MRTAQDLQTAIKFILDEFDRYARMEVTELMACGPEFAFRELVDWKGQRRVIGAKAADVLTDLAQEALASSSYNRRVALGRAVATVFKVIGERYLNPNKKQIDGEEIARDLQDAIEQAAADCATRTHYVPCAIHVPMGKIIEFGPITIASTAAVLDSLTVDIEEYYARPGQTRPGEEFDHVQPVLSYYRAFPDVATVTVEGCDEPMSKALAEKAVQSALNALHVLAGAAYSRKMRVGGPALNNDRRGEIIKAENGLSVTYSIHASGGANLADTWWEDLTERGANLAAAIGQPISAIVQGRDPELLGARFLESAAWYGDAARDPSPASAVVKYLTAMERLLWAGDAMGQVTKRIAERAAALCFSTDTWNLDDIVDDVRSAYTIRSELVHGRLSPADPEVLKSSRLCERVARDLLRVWLDRFALGFGQQVSLGRLKSYLDDFVSQAQRANEQAHRRLDAGTGLDCSIR